VNSELHSEKDMCKSRDERIEKLTEDLNRVEMEKQRVSRQLSTEQRWKQVGVDRIAKLEEELQHIEQEQKAAELRLATKQTSSKFSNN